MSDSDGGGALAVIGTMGVLYWIGYVGAITLIFGVALLAVAIIAGVVFLGSSLFYIASSRKSVAGWLLFIACSIPLLSAPFLIMYFVAMDGHSSRLSSQMETWQEALGPVCFGMIFFNGWLIYKLNDYLEYRYRHR